MLLAGILGLLAGAVSWGVIMPTSRVLILKLGTLSDMARRAQPELYRERIEAIDPHHGPKFQHNRVTRMLRADFSAFGDIPIRLHRDARKLDRKVHIGMIPFGLYLVGVAVWYFFIKH
jgi:hypothetical protein